MKRSELLTINQVAKMLGVCHQSLEGGINLENYKQSVWEIKKELEKGDTGEKILL